MRAKFARGKIRKIIHNVGIGKNLENKKVIWEIMLTSDK